MNAPINFTFRDQQMRVVIIDDDPWWVANDLCAILGLGNVTMALRKLDDDQVALNLIEGIGKNGPVNCVCESGMWMLVLRSDKPEANDLRRWLTREVLPALRKHGYYQMPGYDPPPVQAIDLDPSRLVAGVSVVREARRLFGPVAARGLWVQVGLPPVIPDSEAVVDMDPLAGPLLVYLDGRAETTIQQAAEGMGIANPDWSTRYRIGRLLAQWGWNGRNRKVAKNRTARVFTRPSQIVEMQA
jgi:hypothetical protein